MQILSTTQLRTNTKQLVQKLNTGSEVVLVHRSKPIGTVVPFVSSKKITFSRQAFRQYQDTHGSISPLSDTLRKQRYHQAIKDRHEQRLS